jgi:arsenite methyltransferase
MNMDREQLSEAVQERYGRAAVAASTGATATCCTTSCCAADPITSNLYEEAQTQDLPTAAVLASLGCGNPTALIDLHHGDTVLDLGSGGGIDVLLSAKRVGATGKVYGLDMTDEMLALARSNQAKAGVSNVEFIKGNIEAIPLPDASVDVIISNCVINLAADKDAVLREAFRVLKPRGRFAVSDVVVLGEVPVDIRRSMELWIGCIAGALRDSEYVAKLALAGFTDVSVEPWRIYRAADAADMLSQADIPPDAIGAAEGKFASAFVRATKPVTQKSCCGPECCT